MLPEKAARLKKKVSVLTYKKKLNRYGYKVRKISGKKQTAAFEKIEDVASGTSVSYNYEKSRF